MKTRKNKIRTGAATALPEIAKRCLILVAVLTFSETFITPVQAQCGVKGIEVKAGEEVTYDLSFNWKFVWTKAGKATLNFDKTSYNSRPAYRLNLIAAGNKKADAVFKLRDTLTSYMSEYLEPLYFRKGAIEGKKYWVDEAYFTYKDGVSHVKQFRTRDGEVKEYAYSDSRCIHDLLSVLTWARYMDIDQFKEGDRIGIPVSTGRRVDEQTLIYRGKGIYRAENKVRYNCLKFSLVQKDKKGKEKEVMEFNITDDQNRLPIRLDLYLNFGAAKASLLEVTGNSYPLTSIVED